MKQNKFVLTLFILFLFVSAASAQVHNPDFSKRRQMNSVRSSSALFGTSGGYSPFGTATSLPIIDMGTSGGYSPFGTATSLPIIDMNSSSFNRSSLNIGGTTADLNLKPAAPSGRSLVTSELSEPFSGGTPSRQGLIAPGRGQNGRDDWRVEGPGRNPHEWDFNTGLNPWFSTPLIVAQPLGDAIVPMLLMVLAFAFFKFRKH